MAKITRHVGPTFTDEEAPPGWEHPAQRDAEEQRARTMADELRRRGKLGPYPDQVREAEAAAPDEEVAEGGPASEDEATGVAESEDAGPADTEGEAPRRPAHSATKAEWLAYVRDGLGEDVPDDMTKADLIELYGGD